jgi:glycosyltransferase involved in cell wall biosynthesis
MNLLINCSNLKVGGGLQVAHSFIYELRNYPQHTYTVLVSPLLRKMLNFEDFEQNFIFISYLMKYTWNSKNSFLDNLVVKQNIKAVFTVFGPSYWRPKVSHVCGFAKAQYVYKNSSFFCQLNIIDKIKLHIKELIHLYSFGQTNVLITENKDVSKKIKNLFPMKKIFTVTNYYNQIFDNKKGWDKSLQLPYFDGLTLLTISANYLHKNMDIIPKVVKILCEIYPDFRFRFVVTLNESDLKFDNPKLKEYVIFLGEIHINQCPYLYEQSDIMFLPTLLECFSASYAEAMYMKTPILTSDLDFARGLCGGAALYFDPLSPQDIAGKIITLSEDENLQKTLIKEGLEQLKSFDTYEVRAKKYLDIIENETNHSIS